MATVKGAREVEAPEGMPHGEALDLAVMDSVTAHIAVLDGDGVIRAVNEAWRRFALENGTVPGEPAAKTGVGASYLDACTTEPDGAAGEHGSSVREAIRAVLAGTLPRFSREYRCDSPTGQRWFRMIVTPLGTRGGGAVVSHTDVTDRRQAELDLKQARDSLEQRVAERTEELAKARATLRESNELLTLFIRRSPIYAYIKDVGPTESRLLYASENLVGLTGVPDGALTGKTMQELFPAGLAAKMTDDDWRVASGDSAEEFEEDLEGRSYTTIKFPIAQGEVRRLAGYTIDVTDRRREEADRRALEHQLEQASKHESLGVMAAGIAHQFNNLLAAIKGNLELSRGQVNGEVRELLAEADEAVRRAAVISGALLSYLGQGARRREPRSVWGDVTDVLPALRSALPPGVRLEVDLAGDSPWCRVDRLGLRQVLLNLVTNAGEALQERGGQVRLTAGRVEAGTFEGAETPRASDPGTWVCLEVRDDGPGMSAQALERAFDPFYSTRFTGRGLGLSVAQGLVRAQGGIIRLESTPQGTRAKVYLPESPVGTAASLRPAETLTPPAERERRPRAGAVLVVDDDSAVLRASRNVLRKLGHEVLTAATGAEAVEVYSLRAPTIGSVVLDLNMPGMDGWAVLEALRGLDAEAYVVLASGYDVDQLRAEEHAAQPDAWLQKPFDSAVLATLLRPTGPA